METIEAIVKTIGLLLVIAGGSGFLASINAAISHNKEQPTAYYLLYIAAILAGGFMLFAAKLLLP